MNIFCNAGGTIFHVDTEPIHQGSLGVNKIRLIGQFPSYSQVLMAFTLPDGTVTKPRYLAKAGELDEIKVENGTSFTVWEGLIGATPRIKITGDGNTLKAEPVKDSNGKIVYDLDYTLTEYYGDVDVQFFVYSAGVSVDVDGMPVNNGYGCLATQKARFTIQKGVPMQMDANDLNYDEPKALLTQILAVVANTQELYQDLEKDKLDKSGGTMTGDLELQSARLKVSDSIYYTVYGSRFIYPYYLGKSYNVELPTTSGKIALTNQIEGVYLPLTGGTLTDTLKVYYNDKKYTNYSSGGITIVSGANQTTYDSAKIQRVNFDTGEIRNYNFPKNGGTLVATNSAGNIVLEYSGRSFITNNTKYGDGVIYHEMTGGTRAYTLPNKSGTFALREDVAVLQSDIDGLRQDIINEAHFRGYVETNAEIQALQGNANDYAYSAESGTVWVHQNGGWVNSNKPVPDQMTPASNITPLMDGTASVGSVNAYARGNHRHPTDITRIGVNEKGQANGVASLNEQGQVPNTQLPPFNYLPLTGGKVTGQIIVKGEDDFILKNETTISGNGITIDAIGRLSIGTVAITKSLLGTTTTSFLYPEKTGTLALLEDLDGLVAETDALSQDISVINLTLEQSGLLKKYKQPIEQEYTERVTADGLNVLDGSTAILKKVVGNTVACRNLFDIPNIDTAMGDSAVTLKGNITQNIFVSAGELATVSASIWRFRFVYADGTSAYATDDDLKNGGKKVTATAGNPIVEIVYRGAYITAGQYSKIMIAYGDTATEYQPYFTGLKSASFAGIESTNADGTGTSTLDFPKTETPLGVTIDFENKKITNTYADYTFTGNEGWAKGGNAPSGFERWYCSIPNMASGLSENDYNYGVCDKYTTIVHVNEYYATKKEGVIFGFGAGNNYFQFVCEVGKTEQSVQELTRGMTVRYLLDPAYHTSTNFTAEQSASGNEYTAYKGGTEKVLDNDGAEFGADNTLTQDYILITEVG